MRVGEGRRHRWSLGLVLLAVCGLSACLGQWTHSGADAGNTSANPGEQTLDAARLAQLTREFRVPAAAATYARAPVFSDDTGFVLGTSKVIAFDRQGQAGCSGTPKVCEPLWTASLALPSAYDIAVSDGILYVSADDLYAYDAAGIESCGGIPKTCAPLWSAPTSYSTIVVGGGVVLARFDPPHPSSGFGAISADGTEGCSGSPKVCSPLWRSTPDLDHSAPTIAGDRAFALGPNGAIRAFDLTPDLSACAGDGPQCAPLWTGSFASLGTSPLRPTVQDGVVLVSLTGYPTVSRAAVAFDASGVESCGGTPTVCSPLWSASPTDQTPATLLSNGGALGTTFFAAGRKGYDAFDIHGTGCAGAALTCLPSRRLTTTGFTGNQYPGPIALAGRVAFFSSPAGVSGYDIDGSTSCAGTAPLVCTPIRTWPGARSAVPLDGRLFLATPTGLEAWSPTTP